MTTASERAEWDQPLVTVSYGPISKGLAIVGMTVARAAEVLRAPLNLPSGVIALVNGRHARPGRRLSPGDTLEWVHEVGEKG